MHWLSKRGQVKGRQRNENVALMTPTKLTETAAWQLPGHAPVKMRLEGNKRDETGKTNMALYFNRC